MLTEGELAQLRADEEAEMPDRCRITRYGGRGVFDPVTGNYAAGPDDALIYEGVCRIAGMSAEQREVFGEADVRIGRYVASLPHDVDELKPDDKVEVLEARDPDLVGRPLEVEVVRYGGLHAKRKVVLEEVRP
jgi:hypothetical protein